MKLLNLLVCVAFAAAQVGCAAQRESLMSRPAHSVHSSPAAQTAEIAQPACETVAVEPEPKPRPIRDKLKTAANITGNFLSAPLVFPLIVIGAALGTLPKC